MRPKQQQPTVIYVLNADGTPLQPMHSAPRARRFLREGKATPVCNKPFTIQLTEQRDNPVLGQYTLGIDPGKQNIGLNVIDPNGIMVYDTKAETKNDEVTKHMKTRKQHRQARRHHERQRRQRTAYSATPTLKHRVIERLLPGCEEPIVCHGIKNTQARFNNRTRPAGWLTPTAKNLLETHEHLVEHVMGLLPITDIVLELNRFDFQRMDNPNIRREDYCLGPLHGFKSPKDYVCQEQHGKCLLCGKRKIEHYHHIVPRSAGGADAIGNLCGLCGSCHDAVHKSRVDADVLKQLKAGHGKRYAHLSVLNQVIPFFLEWLDGLDGVNIHVTDGYVTACVRESFRLVKDHDVDAWCVAVSCLGEDVVVVPLVFDPFIIRRHRHHDRALIQSQKERVYSSGGKKIAKNRHKREGQVDDDSLEEARVGRSDVEVSQLVVKKSQRVRQNPFRLLPGAVFLDDKGQRHVLRGTGNKGDRLFSDTLPKTKSGRCIAKSKCTVIAHNTGLVYL